MGKKPEIQGREGRESPLGQRGIGIGREGIYEERKEKEKRNRGRIMRGKKGGASWASLRHGTKGGGKSEGKGGVVAWDRGEGTGDEWGDKEGNSGLQGVRWVHYDIHEGLRKDGSPEEVLQLLPRIGGNKWNKNDRR
ncbi:hypothetical protein WN55_01198 [Dufourea novaeangliae]|uniref:Uncharacterized protein n=1 Tax=Dufourea novaeangliae TaxID=178035 RepID=A0A154PCS6_DUFNO|nr:hypothetical protein WN55_01198 [Dufourea novaeangliae]